MHKRKQLEQVEARNIGIAQTLPHKRCVEQNYRRFARTGDRHAATDPAHAALIGNPDTAMTCVKRGIGQWGRHAADLAYRERKSNT